MVLALVAPPALAQAPTPPGGATVHHRPCQIIRCERIVQSLRGMSVATSASTFVRLQARGPAEPPGQPAEMGVHGDAGDTEAFPSTTFAVFRPRRAG